MIRLAVVFLFSIVCAETRIKGCTRNYEKLGCYKQDNKVFNKILVNDRLATNPDGSKNIYELNWNKYDESLWSLACRCRSKAAADGFTYFAITNYGECAGANDDNQVSQMEVSESCIGIDYKPCDDAIETECAGKGFESYIYKLTAPKINGGFGKWTEYSECSQSCGGGSQFRERKCDSPAPANGGDFCSGLSFETKQCKTQKCPAINGGFSKWTPFSKCSKTCKGGTKYRVRTCTNPAPANGGRDCKGSTRNTVRCNQKVPCNKVDGRYGEWSSYSECTKTCGNGTRFRKRLCNNPPPSNGGKECVGATYRYSNCNYDVACHP